MKKRIKLWVKILIVPVPIGIFFILLYNGFILERIKNRLNSSPSVNIEQIKGNLFTYIDLRGVKFGEGFTASRILLHYTPISIIRKKIKNIEIQSSVIELGGDSTENNSIASPFAVESFTLDNILVLNIPEVEALEFYELIGSLKLEKQEERQILNIEQGQGNIEIKNKSIKIKDINGIVFLEQEFIRVNELFVEAFGGKVNISGIKSQTTDSLNFIIKSYGIQVQEIVETINGIGKLDVRIVKSNDTLSIKGEARLSNGKYKNQNIGELTTDIALLDKDLNLKIKEWKLKDMDFLGDVYVNLDSIPVSYHVVLMGEQINLAEFAKTVSSDLDGKIKIDGKGEEFQSSIDLYGSIEDKKIESIKARILYSPSNISIPSLSVKNEIGTIAASGSIGIEKINLSLIGADVELELFLPQASGVSNFELVIQGNIKSPGIVGTFYIKDFKYGKIKSNYFSGNLNLDNLLPPNGEGEITLANLDLYGNKFENCKAIFNTTPDRRIYEIKAYNDSTNLEIKGDEYEEDFMIRTFLFSSPDIHISNNKNIEFSFKKNRVNIKACELLLNNSLIKTKGLLSKNKCALTVSGKNLNLNSFSDVLEGRTYFTCKLNGSMQRPIISLTSEINNFSYAGAEADKIFLISTYKNHTLYIERGNIIKGKGALKISGKLPIEIPVATSDKPININLTFSNFGEDISFPYRKFVEVKGGNINGKLQIKGNFQKPIFYGNLSFNGESINLKALGTTLTSPLGKLKFENNKIHITSFEGKTLDGFVKMAGSIQIPEKLDIDIYAKNTRIRSIEDVDAVISASLSLEGSVKNPKLKGNIEVKESIITMPFKKRSSVDLKNPWNYDLTVSFPNKVWIKNSMVDAELEGEIKARKEKEDFFLSGDTKVKEGYFYYSYKGIKLWPFKIERGEFEFTNSPELNPKIDIFATTLVNYTVIDENESVDTLTTTTIQKQDTINLQVTGTMRNPEFTLSSYPPMLTEDIITLLSLNMKAGDLSKLQKSQYAQTVGLKAVSSLILRKIALDDLKSQMGVDVLRLEAELFGDEKTARFNVGKYVLKDLYISYTNDLFSPSKHNFKAEYSPWKYSSLVGEATDEGVKTGVQFKIRY